MGDLTLFLFLLLPPLDAIVNGHNARTQAILGRLLDKRGIRVQRGSLVVAVEDSRLKLADGRALDADFMVWATGAAASEWPAQSGLAADAKGFVLVDDCLRSISHPNVFAAGDAATMVNHARPKSGVYAVRQGPPLARNLRRALCREPLLPFTPQSSALALISTGAKYAVASRGRWALEGGWVWHVKDFIDRRFVDGFNRLSAGDRFLG